MQTEAQVQSDYSLDMLNDMFKALHIPERIRLLYEFYDESDILFTSSFGTKSVYLLYLISQIRPSQKVHFLDTTYHFPETIAYKNLIKDQFNLQIIDVVPDVQQHQLTRDGQWWIDHPRMCCTINKIAPLEPIITKHKIWIAGLMAFQTSYRSNLDILVEQGDIIKFHPLIDLDEGQFLYERSYHNLPVHPLEKFGYGSIGCTHCTQVGKGRSGRWNGKDKSECGLHPNYFIQKNQAYRQ